MREIKFRAWDKEEKRFIYPELFGREMPSNWRDFYELTEYTGLKDKNGAEIYEGDIYVQGDKNIKYVVESNNAQFSGRQVGNKSLAGLSYFQDKVEVIGNIHENPELLSDVPKAK